jgi:hypothetical protein
MKSATREDPTLGTCSSVGLLSNSQIKLTGMTQKTPVDTFESRENTDFDLGTQETYRSNNSTLVIFDEQQRPMTQRNLQEVRIKKRKKIRLLQEKYEIY